MLNVGDKVFISKYGAGIVLDISERNFFSESCKYIIIYLIIDDMDLYIPENKIKNYNIRYIVSCEVMENAIKKINDINICIEKNWNKRYRKNNKKIISGDIFQICEVLRDLYYLERNEMLPLGEEKILRKAENMVVSEMMLVFGISKKDAYKKLEIKNNLFSIT